MGVLTLSTLNPDVSSVEDYLSKISSDEFKQLLDISNSDLSAISDDELADLTALSVNIYSTEMEIDPFIIMKDINMINTIVKRFLSSIVIYSLIKKGFLEKTDKEEISLYKDVSFKPTKKGEIVAKMLY